MIDLSSLNEIRLPNGNTVAEVINPDGSILWAPVLGGPPQMTGWDWDWGSYTTAPDPTSIFMTYYHINTSPIKFYPKVDPAWLYSAGLSEDWTGALPTTEAGWQNGGDVEGGGKILNTNNWIDYLDGHVWAQFITWSDVYNIREFITGSTNDRVTFWSGSGASNAFGVDTFKGGPSAFQHNSADIIISSHNPPPINSNIHFNLTSNASGDVRAAGGAVTANRGVTADVTQAAGENLVLSWSGAPTTYDANTGSETIMWELRWMPFDRGDNVTAGGGNIIRNTAGTNLWNMAMTDSVTQTLATFTEGGILALRILGPDASNFCAGYWSRHYWRIDV